MSEVLVPAAEFVAAPGGQAFNPKAAMLSIGVSLFVNGVLPFALYKVLVPHFASGSVMPLLWASAFPLIGLVIGLIRTRTIDVVAVFALFGIVYSVGWALFAGEIRLAMIFGSTQAFVIAIAFFVSALVGRPIIFYIVRQFIAGQDPKAVAHFTAIDKADNSRTCKIATMAWALAVVLQGIAGVALAFTMAPATYLLATNIINTAVNVVMIVWTIRFVRTRLMAVGANLATA